MAASTASGFGGNRSAVLQVADDEQHAIVVDQLDVRYQGSLDPQLEFDGRVDFIFPVLLRDERGLGL